MATAGSPEVKCPQKESLLKQHALISPDDPFDTQKLTVRKVKAQSFSVYLHLLGVSKRTTYKRMRTKLARSSKVNGQMS